MLYISQESSHEPLYLGQPQKSQDTQAQRIVEGLEKVFRWDVLSWPDEACDIGEDRGRDEISQVEGRWDIQYHKEQKIRHLEFRNQFQDKETGSTTIREELSRGHSIQCSKEYKCALHLLHFRPESLKGQRVISCYLSTSSDNRSWRKRFTILAA